MIQDLIISTLPKFSLIRPTTGNKIWFRPFLVKEEKKLLTAQTLGSKEEIIKAIEETINSCFDDINASTLPTFEFEYFYVQLRMKSISESISAKLTCPETGEKIDLDLDLGEIKVSMPEKSSKNIEISDKIIFTMRYPTYSDIMQLKEENSYEDSIDLAVNCITTITTPDAVHSVTKDDKKELKETILNLTPKQFSKIIDFFDSMPKYEYIFKYKTSDGIERSVLLSGIEDFFTVASVT